MNNKFCRGLILYVYWATGYHASRFFMPSISRHTGSKQTNDLKFQNGAYYNSTGVNLGVATDIKKCVAQTSKTTSVKIYTLQGSEVGTTNNGQRALQQLPKGVYLINHKKVVVP